MRTLLKFSMIFLLCASGGCASKLKSVNGVSCASLLDTFLLKSEPIKADLFVGFSQEKKYAALICGNQNAHPPLMIVAHLYAKDGPSSVPFLKKKLEIEKADPTIRDIFLVFEVMQRRGYYDVIHDSELLELIVRKTSTIQDEYWRDSLKERLNKLNREFKDIPFRANKSD